jgi:hypothetical protein
MQLSPDSPGLYALPVWCRIALGATLACGDGHDSGAEDFDRSSLSGVWINVIDDPRFDVYEDYALGRGISRGYSFDSATGTATLEHERAVLRLAIDDPSQIDVAEVGSVLQRCPVPWTTAESSTAEWDPDAYFSTFPAGDGRSAERPLVMFNVWQYHSDEGPWMDQAAQGLLCFRSTADLLLCRWLDLDSDGSDTLLERRIAFRRSPEGALRRKCDALLSDYLLGGERP